VLPRVTRCAIDTAGGRDTSCATCVGDDERRDVVDLTRNNRPAIRRSLMRLNISERVWRRRYSPSLSCHKQHNEQAGSHGGNAQGTYSKSLHELSRLDETESVFG